MTLPSLAELLPFTLWRRWLSWQSRRLPADLPDALHHYMTGLSDAVSGPLEQAHLLAMDLELTALNTDKGEIVALGCVQLDQLSIRLASAQQWMVKPKGEVGDSAVHHQLTDQQLADGEPLAQVLLHWLVQARGRVLLLHHAELDLAFIRAALQAEFGWVPPLPAIDTMQLGAAIQRYQNPERPVNKLRLSQQREQYGLPPHHGHQALADAIACAELFFAQVSHRYQQIPDVSALLSKR